MSHRPYPSADRALRQLDRHNIPAAPRQPSEFELRMAQQATAVQAGVATAFRPYVEAARASAATLGFRAFAEGLRQVRIGQRPAERP